MDGEEGTKAYWGGGSAVVLAHLYCIMSVMCVVHDAAGRRLTVYNDGQALASKVRGYG